MMKVLFDEPVAAMSNVSAGKRRANESHDDRKPKQEYGSDDIGKTWQ